MEQADASTALDRKNLRSRALVDAGTILGLGILIFLISSRFDLFYKIVDWVHAQNDMHLDDLLTVALYLAFASVVFILRRRNELLHQIQEREKIEAEKAHLVPQLQQALAEVRTLSGLLPICAWCKKIRDDKGYWNQLEEYIELRTGAEFTHGICPDCAQKVHGGTQSDTTGKP